MTRNIPLFDLSYGLEEEQAVLAVLRSKWISTGPRCLELEEQFKEKLGASHAVTLSNCTSALHLALLALGIGEGDEVILPSLTFVATANAVRYVGAKPVFCDIKGTHDLNLDPNLLETLVTPRTKALIVMHYAGFPCDMDELLEVAGRHNLRIVEDACHGPLSEYRGRKLGTIGDIGCFSFFSNKNISTGEGGLLVTDDERLAARVRLLRSHGMTSLSYDRHKGHETSYDVVGLGYNYRMDDIRASLGLAQLAKLPADLQKRAEIRRWYVEHLSRTPGIIIPFRDLEGPVSNYIFPVVLASADAELRHNVRDKLRSCGIQTSVHYPAVHKFSIYNSPAVVLPVTEYVTDAEITLPMYSALEQEDVGYICGELRKAVAAA